MSELNNYYLDDSESRESGVGRYMAKVMGWMCLGLALTVMAALAALTIPPLFNIVMRMSFILFIVEIGLVIGLSSGISKMSGSAATAMFLIYAVVSGLTLSYIFIVYPTLAIITAFGVSSMMFLLMATYGFVTKKDTTKLAPILLFGLIGVILASVINIFAGNSTIDIIISIAGVVLFSALTIYDTQKIKEMYLQTAEVGHEIDSEVVHKTAIIGALKLYLDFINLFLYILRLLARKRR